MSQHSETRGMAQHWWTYNASKLQIHQAYWRCFETNNGRWTEWCGLLSRSFWAVCLCEQKYVEEKLKRSGKQFEEERHLRRCRRTCLNSCLRKKNFDVRNGTPLFCNASTSLFHRRRPWLYDYQSFQLRRGTKWNDIPVSNLLPRKMRWNKGVVFLPWTAFIKGDFE